MPNGSGCNRAGEAPESPFLKLAQRFRFIAHEDYANPRLLFELTQAWAGILANDAVRSGLLELPTELAELRKVCEQSQDAGFQAAGKAWAQLWASIADTMAIPKGWDDPSYPD